MVAGMGGGETGTDRAIVDKDPYIIPPGRVLTGTKPEYQVFHPMTADQIANDSRHNKR